MHYTTWIKSLLAIAIIAFWTNDAAADGNVLTNGDFANGKANWGGDVKDASEGDVTNITASMDSQTKSSGMVLTLKPKAWTQVTQVFSTRETALAFNMKYQTSADFAETAPQGMQGGEAYFTANLSTLLGIPLQQDPHIPPHPMGMPGMNNPSGSSPFVGIVIADLSQNTVFSRYIPLRPSPDAPNMLMSIFNKLEAHEEKTFYAFFPPGTGTITFYNISLSKPAANGGQPGMPGAPVSDRPFSPGGGVPPNPQ